MNLFSKDLFSQSFPSWSKKDCSNLEKYSFLVDELEKKYNFESSIVLYALDTLNINSKNFLCLNSNKKYIVKLIDQNDNGKIEKLENVLDHLSNQNLNIPKTILNNKNEKFTNNSSFSIHVSEFIKGRYFKGGENDIKSSCRSINAINNILMNMKPSKSIASLPELIDKPHEILNHFLNSEKASKKLIGDRLTDILFKRKKEVFNSLDYLSSKKIRSKGVYPLHCDLHPHNILISENRAFILDLDSVYRMPIEHSLGFAFFKLLRQDIANSTFTKSSSKLMLKMFNNNLNIGEFSLNTFYYFSKKEALRRIILILNENLEYGFSSWNSVLETQLKALEEINYLYSNA